MATHDTTGGTRAANRQDVAPPTWWKWESDVQKKKESESDVQTTESESDAKIKLFTGFKIDLPGILLQCPD